MALLSPASLTPEGAPKTAASTTSEGALQQQSSLASTVELRPPGPTLGAPAATTDVSEGGAVYEAGVYEEGVYE